MTGVYVVNRVKYIVDSHFEPAGNKQTLADKLRHYIKNYFTDFTTHYKGDIMAYEYVLTAGKEK